MDTMTADEQRRVFLAEYEEYCHNVVGILRDLRDRTRAVDEHASYLLDRAMVYSRQARASLRLAQP